MLRGQFGPGVRRFLLGFFCGRLGIAIDHRDPLAGRLHGPAFRTVGAGSDFCSGSAAFSASAPRRMKAADRLDQLPGQRQVRVVVGGKLLETGARGDPQDVVHAVDEHQLRVGLGSLERLGVGDADLDVIAALDDQGRDAQAAERAGRVFAEQRDRYGCTLGRSRLASAGGISPRVSPAFSEASTESAWRSCAGGRRPRSCSRNTRSMGWPLPAMAINSSAGVRGAARLAISAPSLWPTRIQPGEARVAGQPLAPGDHVVDIDADAEVFLARRRRQAAGDSTLVVAHAGDSAIRPGPRRDATGSGCCRRGVVAVAVGGTGAGDQQDHRRRHGAARQRQEPRSTPCPVSRS